MVPQNGIVESESVRSRSRSEVAGSKLPTPQILIQLRKKCFFYAHGVYATSQVSFWCKLVPGGFVHSIVSGSTS